MPKTRQTSSKKISIHELKLRNNINKKSDKKVNSQGRSTTPKRTSACVKANKHIESKKQLPTDFELRTELKLLQESTKMFVSRQLNIDASVILYFCWGVYYYLCTEVYEDLTEAVTVPPISALLNGETQGTCFSSMLYIMCLISISFPKEIYGKLFAHLLGKKADIFERQKEIENEKIKKAFEVDFCDPDLTSKEIQEQIQVLTEIANLSPLKNILSTALIILTLSLMLDCFSFYFFIVAFRQLVFMLSNFLGQKFFPNSVRQPLTSDKIALAILNQLLPDNLNYKIQWQKFSSIVKKKSIISDIKDAWLTAYLKYVTGEYYESHWYWLDLQNLNISSEYQALLLAYQLELVKQSGFKVISINDKQLIVYVPIEKKLSNHKQQQHLKTSEARWSQLKLEQNNINILIKKSRELFKDFCSQAKFSVNYIFSGSGVLELGLFIDGFVHNRKNIALLKTIYSNCDLSHDSEGVAITRLVDARKIIATLDSQLAEKDQSKKIAYDNKPVINIKPYVNKQVSFVNNNKLVNRTKLQNNIEFANKVKNNTQLAVSSSNKKFAANFYHIKKVSNTQKLSKFFGGQKFTNIVFTLIINREQFKVKPKHFLKIQGLSSAYLFWNKEKIKKSKFYKSADKITYQKYKQIAHQQSKLCRIHGENGVALYDKQNGPKLKWRDAPGHKRLKLEMHKKVNIEGNKKFNSNNTVTVYEVTGKTL